MGRDCATLPCFPFSAFDWITFKSTPIALALPNCSAMFSWNFFTFSAWTSSAVSGSYFTASAFPYVSSPPLPPEPEDNDAMFATSSCVAARSLCNDATCSSKLDALDQATGINGHLITITATVMAVVAPIGAQATVAPTV